MSDQAAKLPAGAQAALDDALANCVNTFYRAGVEMAATALSPLFAKIEKALDFIEEPYMGYHARYPGELYCTECGAMMRECVPANHKPECYYRVAQEALAALRGAEGKAA